MGTETEAGVKIRRKTAFVFQNYNLFRNKTALQNVTEGLVIARKMPRSQAEKAGKRALDKVGLWDRYDYYPHQLSGGQQQRVWIARAIAPAPEVILFDEPTSGLDLFHMRQVANVVNQVADAGRTALVVTQDPEFILRCCNYVIHLENGQIQESYSIEDSDGKKHLLKFFLSDMIKEG